MSEKLMLQKLVCKTWVRCALFSLVAVVAVGMSMLIGPVISGRRGRQAGCRHDWQPAHHSCNQHADGGGFFGEHHGDIVQRSGNGCHAACLPVVCRRPHDSKYAGNFHRRVSLHHHWADWSACKPLWGRRPPGPVRFHRPDFAGGGDRVAALDGFSVGAGTHG